MPTTAISQPRQAAPTRVKTKSSRSSIANFDFPADHHLLITTESHVCNWTDRGLTAVFKSGSGGILEAKEAKDGSGQLAVADSQNVLLHNVPRGMDRSYRLNGTDGQVRCIEFASDSQRLFFTTNLSNAVQTYSLSESRLLHPLHEHPSPPVALAVSPITHLVVSASENPPTLHVQNVSLQSPPFLLKPRASDLPAVVVVFHPERPDIFLLAFKDGTLAAYNASRISRVGVRDRVRALDVSHDGEIGHFSGLWRVSNRQKKDPTGLDSAAAVGHHDTSTATSSVGAQAVGITAAAFLPGYRTRAVAAGIDGKCRLVDFAQGGKILRTWHVRGPATCLSVLHVKPKTVQWQLDGSEEQDSKNNIIAIGRQDGKVLLYDSIGLLLREKTVAPDSGRVIGIEWSKGPGPRPRDGSEHVNFSEDGFLDLTPMQREVISGLNKSSTRRASVMTSRRASRVHNPCPPSLGAMKRKSIASLDGSEQRSLDLNNPSPMEQDGEFLSDTVRRVKTAGPAVSLPPPSHNVFMDLFSPVPQSKPRPSPQYSPRKQYDRPRISSATFRDEGLAPSLAMPSKVKATPSPMPPPLETGPPLRGAIIAEPPVATSSLIGASVDGEKTRRPDWVRSHGIRFPIAKAPSAMTSDILFPVRTRRTKPRRASTRRISMTKSAMPGSYVSSSAKSSQNETSTESSLSQLSEPETNAKILADLRRVAKNGEGDSSASPKNRNRGPGGSGRNASLFAPYIPSRPERVHRHQDVHTSDSDLRQTNSSLQDTDTILSLSDLSADSSVLEDDLWLTSESDHQPSRRPSRTRAALSRISQFRIQKTSRPSSRFNRPIADLHHSESSSKPSSSRGTSSRYEDSASSLALPMSSGTSSVSINSDDDEDSESTVTATFQTAPTRQMTFRSPSAAHPKPRRVSIVETADEGLPLAATRSPVRATSTSAGTPIRRPSVAAELAPGVADSPEGPVRIEKYYPRKSSLVKLNKYLVNPCPEKSPTQKTRAALGKSSGNGRLGSRHAPQGFDIWDDAFDDETSSSRIKPSKASSIATRYDNLLERSGNPFLDDNIPMEAGLHHGNGMEIPTRMNSNSTCVCNGVCCGDLRKEVADLKDQVSVLRGIMQGMISTSPKKKRGVGVYM